MAYTEVIEDVIYKLQALKGSETRDLWSEIIHQVRENNSLTHKTLNKVCRAISFHVAKMPEDLKHKFWKQTKIGIRYTENKLPMPDDFHVDIEEDILERIGFISTVIEEEY